jgi:hypothetical protein
VARVRQVVAKFDQAAVNFGDPKAPAPLSVSCSDAQAGKRHRPLDRRAKAWVYDFENDLPPGVRCTCHPQPGFKPSAGGELSGPEQLPIQHRRARSCSNYMPGTYGPHRRAADVRAASSTARPRWRACRPERLVRGRRLGERIPVKLLDGAASSARLLKAFSREKAAEKDPLRYVTLAVQPHAHANARQGAGGLRARASPRPRACQQRREAGFDYQVREPFAVSSFTCERENAQAACLPLRPMQLTFNAPVTRKLASQIELKGDGKAIKAQLRQRRRHAERRRRGQRRELRPAAGREHAVQHRAARKVRGRFGPPLATPSNFPLKVATGAMPPLAKFAASPFGVIERLAEPDTPAMMPVTVRRVEPQPDGARASRPAR